MASRLRVRSAFPSLGFGVLLALLLTGCATCERSAGRQFITGKDNFAFQNDLFWEYEFKPKGIVRTRKVEPAPEHPHRCFPIVRTAREFLYHARFDFELPKVEEVEYRELVQEIMGRNSRCPSAAEQRVIIPGYSDLHAFSEAHPELLRAACGGSWRSYLQRGNWRMIFPVTDRGERKTARRLVAKLQSGRLPIVHLHKFPDVRLNHAILVHGVMEQENGFLFQAYDPNNPGKVAQLSFDQNTDSFHFERNQYFAGGVVKVYEVYRGWCY